ncbi:hypothetical protein llap_16520 [Limosa lapponica baueri]|uniref:Uncharacterized protein n=1 Tax=Limosa lapponica baueri TaxID=1758121 RepID=A0A2I0THD0_LIMLA|nr:hypothetical protein llap_16520 [Limosa lapponica baueri]
MKTWKKNRCLYKVSYISAVFSFPELIKSLESETKAFGLSECLWVKAPGDNLASEGELDEEYFRELYNTLDKWELSSSENLAPGLYTYGNFLFEQ